MKGVNNDTSTICAAPLILLSSRVPSNVWKSRHSFCPMAYSTHILFYNCRMYKVNAETTLAVPHLTQGKNINKMGSLSFKLLGEGCTLGLLRFFYSPAPEQNLHLLLEALIVIINNKSVKKYIPLRYYI